MKPKPDGRGTPGEIKDGWIWVNGAWEDLNGRVEQRRQSPSPLDTRDL